jgi:hypothetical protein
MKWLWLILSIAIVVTGQNISQYASLDTNSSFFNSTQAAIEQAKETRIHLLWGISFIMIGTVACVATMTIAMTLLVCGSTDETDEMFENTSPSECFPCYGLCLLMMFFAHLMGGCWNVIPTCCDKCKRKKRQRKQRRRNEEGPTPLIPLGPNVASSLHLSESTFRGDETDTVDASDILDVMMY